VTARRSWTVADIYGPQAGDSTMLHVAGVPHTVRGVQSPYSRGHHEGQPQVTPSTSSGGVTVGQFTLAEATIGLLVLLGLIAYFDKQVLKA
jgi:hypothetical protein